MKKELFSIAEWDSDSSNSVGNCDLRLSTRKITGRSRNKDHSLKMSDGTPKTTPSEDEEEVFGLATPIEGSNQFELTLRNKPDEVSPLVMHESVSGFQPDELPELPLSNDNQESRGKPSSKRKSNRNLCSTEKEKPGAKNKKGVSKLSVLKHANAYLSATSSKIKKKEASAKSACTDDDCLAKKKPSAKKVTAEKDESMRDFTNIVLSMAQEYLDTHQDELKKDEEQRHRSKKETADETKIISASQTHKKRSRSLNRESNRRRQSRSQSRGRKTAAQSCRDLSFPIAKDVHQGELKKGERDQASDLQIKEIAKETEILSAFQTPKQRRRSLSRERNRRERSRSRSQSRGRKTSAKSCRDLSSSEPQKAPGRRNRSLSRDRVAARQERSDQNPTKSERRSRSRERLAARRDERKERAGSKSHECQPESKIDKKIPKVPSSLERQSRSTSRQNKENDDSKIQSRQSVQESTSRRSKSKQRPKKGKSFSDPNTEINSSAPKNSKLMLEPKPAAKSPRKMAISPRPKSRHSAPSKLATEVIFASPSAKSNRKIVFSPSGTAKTETDDGMSVGAVPDKRFLSKTTRAVSNWKTLKHASDFLNKTKRGKNAQAKKRDFIA